MLKTNVVSAKHASPSGPGSAGVHPAVGAAAASTMGASPRSGPGVSAVDIVSFLLQTTNCETRGRRPTGRPSPLGRARAPSCLASRYSGGNLLHAQRLGKPCNNETESSSLLRFAFPQLRWIIAWSSRGAPPEIERALNVLQDAGRLRRETRQPERGRTAEVWIPILAQAA